MLMRVGNDRPFTSGLLLERDHLYLFYPLCFWDLFVATAQPGPSLPMGPPGGDLFPRQCEMESWQNKAEPKPLTGIEESEAKSNVNVQVWNHD